VGMQTEPLLRFGTQSVLERVPTQSVGTIRGSYFLQNP
jgi:hypothetical protein